MRHAMLQNNVVEEDKVIQIIVDETAQSSLEFLTALQKVGKVERAAEGIYYIEGYEKSILHLTEQYPRAVIRAEAV